MRFLIRVLILGALATVVGTHMLAQRGGSGARAGAVSSGHSFSSARSAAHPAASGYAAPRGFRASASGYTANRAGAFRSRGVYGRDYRRLPYGYFFTPYYYPFLDYGSSPYFDNGYDSQPDPDAQGPAMAENALGDEVQRLGAEVDQLAYGQQAQQAAAYPQQYLQPAPQAPPVMLVLRSGQQLEVQNYAVMDQTFWDFTRQPARKIPIASIDIAASARATQAKGGEFPQLEAGQ